MEADVNPVGLTTIGVGNCRREDVLRDNAGDNIADLNPYLNEATAIYRVWKDKSLRDVPYVGFCHYRRFLIFKPLRDRRTMFLGSCSLDTSLYKHLPKFSCSLDDAERVLQDDMIDGVIPVSDPVGLKNGLRAALAKYSYASEKWVNRALELLAAHAPECADFFNDAFGREGSWLYICNTFVMRTPLFEKMCETLFPVILQLTEEWMADPSPKVTPREPGYITEFLVGTYWRYLEEHQQARFIHCRYLLFLTNAHKHWFFIFSRFAYRFFPNWFATVLKMLHYNFVIRRLMPKP